MTAAEEAGLAIDQVFEREAYPEVQVETQRFYVLARYPRMPQKR